MNSSDRHEYERFGYKHERYGEKSDSGFKYYDREQSGTAIVRQTPLLRHM
jgi:hypothetical protein